MGEKTPKQLNLFGEDFRTDKEKFADFSRPFLDNTRIDLYYPELFSNKKAPIFFKTLKNLYTSHVINGAWTDELFEKSVMHTIENRKTLCAINIEQSATIVNPDNNDNPDNNEDM